MDLETRNFINVKISDSQAKIRKEVIETAKKEARKALRVPGLIGEHCPYSTFANFMTQFQLSTTKAIDESRVQSVSFDNRLTDSENKAKMWKKEVENILKEMEDMKREDARATSAIFTLRKQLGEIGPAASQLTEHNVSFLKDLNQDKWYEITKKVDKIPDKVFNEVIMAEMSLAQLENVNTEREQIPEETLTKHQSSLLTRMNTLKVVLKEKQKKGQAVAY